MCTLERNRKSSLHLEEQFRSVSQWFSLLTTWSESKKCKSGPSALPVNNNTGPEAALRMKTFQNKSHVRRRFVGFSVGFSFPVTIAYLQ